MQKVWLITGSASGLGRAVAEAVLAAGDRVVAGARQPLELSALVGQYGDAITPVELDVRDESAAKAAVREAMRLYGQLDVLVNNAGYQFNAPFEQIPADKFRDVIETCLFGVVYTTRAVIPVMREQRRGHIFQVSSIGGRVTIPGNSPYHAAKWAIGGFSDSVAEEVGPFGVKVCTLEPGGIRTNFKERAGKELPKLLPEYEASVGPIYKMMSADGRSSENNPEKIASLIISLAEAENVPKRLILGKSANEFVERIEAARKDESMKYRDLTLSTVFSDKA